VSSTPSSTPNPNDRQQSRFSSRIWIGLSFLLSTVILGWSFTLPFRQAGKTMVSSEQHAEQVDLTDVVRQRQTSAEEFRDAAIALDQEFMRSLAKRNQPKRDLPGIEHTKRAWQRHQKLVETQVRQLKNAEEGTLEASYRQELINSFEDGPRP
jgi:hypothetical protein